MARGDRVLFKDLSLTLVEGQALQLRGANGSGKTTLLRVIAGLSEPQAGQIWFRKVALPAARQALGIAACWCGHRDGLKSDLSVRENLTLHQKLSGRSAAMSVESAASALGVADLLDLAAGVLSAGQRRRVALSRLLLLDAILWLLDEPFTHLDRESQEVLSGLIISHCHKGGACVLATHDLPTALTGQTSEFLVESFA